MRMARSILALVALLFVAAGSLYAQQPLTMLTTSLPVGVLGTSYSFSLKATGGQQPYTWSTGGAQLPIGVSLSGSTIAGTPAWPIGDFHVSLRVTDAAGTTVSRSLGLTVVEQTPLIVATNSLDLAPLGQPYSFALSVAGGVPPYSWIPSPLPVPFPSGLSLSASGSLNGTPVASGPVMVRVTDGLGRSADKALSLMTLPSIAIQTASLPGAVLGIPYSQQLIASGGSPPYTWSIVVGNVSGMTLSPSGTFFGIPNFAAQNSVVVRVTDGFLVTTGILTIETILPLEILTPPLGTAVIGHFYRQGIGARGGMEPYTWSLAPGSKPLPPGLSFGKLPFSETDVIGGTPLGPAGIYPFTVRVTDAQNHTVDQSQSITVYDPPKISSISPSVVMAGTGTFTLTVNGMNFIEEARARWNVFDYIDTVFINGTTLRATVFSSLISQAGTAGVSVANLHPMGAAGVSADVPLIIVKPEPTVLGLSPRTRVLGGSDFTLTVRGTDFLPGSTVRWNDAALPTVFVSTAELTATVGGSLANTPGEVLVTVLNPPPGRTSKPLAFVLENPSPVLTGLNPSSAQKGQGPLTITLTGSRFVPQSQAQWDGTPLQTTFVSATELHVRIAANLIAQAGSASIRVLNPLPGGGRSFPLTFTIGEEPVEPTVTLNLAGNPAPAQQIPVLLTLSPASSLIAAGELKLDFVPQGQLPNDPAVQFSTGGRTADFLVPAGRTAPYFPNGALLLQTGTVAGRVTVTMTSLRSGNKDVLPSPSPVQTLLVNQEAPRITGLRIINRTTTSFAVEVEGFTTPREITQATFQFTPKPGQTLTTTETVAALSEAARNWFQNPASFDFGGQFVYTKPFTFEGGVDSIASISVTLSNTLGASNKVTASF